MQFLENLSSLTQNSYFAAWFFDALLKSFIILTLAGGVVVALRRAAAATRHLVWFLALLSLLCLPLLTSVLPSWEKSPWSVSTGFDSGNQLSLAIELLPKEQPESATLDLPSASRAGITINHATRKIATRFSVNWLAYGLAAWMAGALLVMLSVIAGPIHLLKFSRTTQPEQGDDWLKLLTEVRNRLQLRRNVVLLQSSENVMPLTWGWWRPVVLLPAEAAHWTADRRRIVLLHELAHVKRWDCLTQVVAKIVCAFYWFNPLVWLAARQMCVERERACDDLVLSGGCKASDYAGHLVEIAESFRRAPQVAAIAMARPNGLEQRISAIVDSSRNRRVRRLTLLTIVAAVSGIVFCVSGCKTTIARSSAEKFSSLRDQQIARLETFSKLKEKQSEVLAAAAGEKISPEYKRFFTAATQGDWQTVTNMYESFKRRHPQYGHPHQHSDLSLRTSYWQPVLEICLAYDQVVRCDPKYTQLAVDDIIHSIPKGSIYFGGTDPGRGLPTAFCKSQPDANPFYTLTQNALADRTYLEYLRDTYGDRRSLLNQMAEACRNDTTIHALNARWATAVQKLDSLEINEDDPQWKKAQSDVNTFELQRKDRLNGLWASVKYRDYENSETVSNQTIPNTLYIPTAEDSQRCFEEYVTDVTKRYHSGQLKPGENVKISDGRTQISGKVAVMQINGLLAKIIFDKNPGHEFFIEQSFPLDWMYPYLEPHGLIFKINRQPLPALNEAMIQNDENYWQPLVDQMIGGWLKSDTSVKDVTSFAEKVFLQHDLDGFTGDSDFVKNDYASRMFSKLRCSIAGLYAWRCEQATANAEKERMANAADFAFRQALALCPSSSETAERYATFLQNQHREDDAQLVKDLEAQFKSQSTNSPASKTKAQTL